MFKPLVLLHTRLFKDFISCSFRNVLARMWNGEHARFLLVFEDMVTAFNAIQIPTLRFDEPDQLSAAVGYRHVLFPLMDVSFTSPPWLLI